MAKGKNCPNCGTVIEVENDKCAYCGTSYFDLSCIPINEPFYLKINLGTKDKPKIVTQKVVTTGVTIDYHTELMNACCGLSGNIVSFGSTPSPDYHFDFVSIR